MDRQQSASLPHDRRSGKRFTPPELLIDLEADNALLRTALARSEGDGVRRALVTEELRHRMGNMLAVVQAVARHTFRNAEPSTLEDFSARLHALAAAQKLLINAETGTAVMADVVRGALVTYCSDDNRVAISGPDLAIDGRRAHALTLALHELATNAAKYGALSVDGGWVEVSWASAGGRLDFLWREHDGPPVTAPTRKGFGSVLITRNLGVAFAGEVDLDFRRTGVECRLQAPHVQSTGP